MPQFCRDWIKRVKNAELEHAAMRFSADRLLDSARRDSAILPADFRIRDLIRASSALEGTYVVRLYAEFETGLRSWWSTIRPTQPPSGELMNAIAARRQIPSTALDLAHAIREYRNHLVHERNEPASSVPIADARQAACVFLSFPPPKW